MDSDNDELADFAWRKIVAGYLPRDAVIDAVTDRAAGRIEPSEASALVQGLWDERLQAQGRWPAMTDCDRLDKAFELLVDEDMLAKQNYGCCLRHGFEALAKEPNAAQSVGFVYFAEPDTEEAVDGQGLFLAFGAFASKTAALPERRVIAVGEQVVATLRAQGLRVQWAGGPDDRIWLDLDWERRVPAGWFESVG